MAEVKEGTCLHCASLKPIIYQYIIVGVCQYYFTELRNIHGQLFRAFKDGWRTFDVKELGPPNSSQEEL